MEIKIEKANIDDLESLKELYKKLHLHHVDIDETYVDENYFEKKLEKLVQKVLAQEYTSVLIAKVDGIAAGFGVFQIKSKPTIVQKYGYIKKAYVDKEFRGQGIFKKLYEKGMEWFRENGIEFVELTCNVNNVEGQSTWAALGFEEVKKVLRKKI